MLGYRVFFVGRDGHISSAVEVECKDDAEALAAATRLAEGLHVELWQGKRRIAALNEGDTKVKW
jgi:hypothetical protein